MELKSPNPYSLTPWEDSGKTILLFWAGEAGQFRTHSCLFPCLVDSSLGITKLRFLPSSFNKNLKLIQFNKLG